VHPVQQGNDDRDRQTEEDYRSPLSPRLYEEAYKIEKTEQYQQLDWVIAKETVLWRNSLVLQLSLPV